MGHADIGITDTTTWGILQPAGGRDFTDDFRDLWPLVVDWVRPYYDSTHLFVTAAWILTLEPAASEPLVVASATHDMERHFPGGTQPDKAAGAWDDVEYNTRHMERSAQIVSQWLSEQRVSADFISAVRTPILHHEFGGSSQDDLIQAADSLSFLDVNAELAARWVRDGEATLPSAIKKLDWMYERIKLPDAREIAGPIHERAVRTVRAAAGVEVDPPE